MIGGTLLGQLFSASGVVDSPGRGRALGILLRMESRPADCPICLLDEASKASFFERVPLVAARIVRYLSGRRDISENHSMASARAALRLTRSAE